MKLLHTNALLTTLAEGSYITINEFAVKILWGNQEKQVWVLEGDEEPLIGMELLQDQRMSMDIVEGGTVTNEPLS